MYSIFANLLLPFLGVLAALVFVHELGHYVAARLAGVAVERFSIGFGPGITLGRDRNGTEWRVGILPLGGYVRLGVSDRPLTATGRRFDEAGRAARAAIAAAGPAANLVFAFVLMLGSFTLTVIERAEPVVAHVSAGSPAAAAGLRAGDRILSVNGSRPSSFREIEHQAALHLNAPLRLVIQRGTEQQAVVVRPVVAEVRLAGGRRERVGLIGAAGPAPAPDRLGLGEGVRAAARATVGYARDTLVGLHQILSGERSFRSLGGMIGIAHLVGDILDHAG